MQFVRCACLLFVLIAMVGCEVPRVGAPHHVTGSTLQNGTPNCEKDSDPQLCALAKKNVTELAWYKDNEWAYNRQGSKEERPQLCVSFSGGGIRSAAFAIGVLQGLHEKKVGEPSRPLLKHVDVLSGTSGGAYAVSWYYMQQPDTSRRPEDYDKDVFSPSGYTQAYLRDHAHFLGMPAYIGSFAFDLVPLSAVNFALNGLWGWHANTSLGHLIYKWNIRETFHRGATTTLNLLDQTIREYGLPYFIITTTSRIDENNFHSEAKLRNTVFEFTPLHIGNDAFTYVRSDEHAELSNLDTIVTISGAAPDSSQLVSGSTKRVLMSVFNQDYGHYVSNYNDTRHGLWRFLTKLAPFPVYLATESYNRDRFGSDIYLSDGGHQENLAAYPLIRRQCEHIIMVDGEYDPDYEFESYFKLKHSIEEEMHVAMKLNKTTFCAESARVGCRDTNIDEIEERLRKNNELPGTRGEAEGRRKGITRCCFTSQHPVVSGSIGHFPMYDPVTKRFRWQDVTLTYIKLAIDEELFRGWEHMCEKHRDSIKAVIGTDASDYFASTVTNTCAVRYFYPCNFPQFSTAYQSFTPEQFKAYTDLGAHIVEHHLSAEILGGHIKITPLDAYRILTEEVKKREQQPCKP